MDDLLSLVVVETSTSGASNIYPSPSVSTLFNFAPPLPSFHVVANSIHYTFYYSHQHPGDYLETVGNVSELDIYHDIINRLQSRITMSAHTLEAISRVASALAQVGAIRAQGVHTLVQIFEAVLISSWPILVLAVAEFDVYLQQVQHEPTASAAAALLVQKVMENIGAAYITEDVDAIALIIGGDTPGIPQVEVTQLDAEQQHQVVEAIFEKLPHMGVEVDPLMHQLFALYMTNVYDPIYSEDVCPFDFTLISETYDSMFLDSFYHQLDELIQQLYFYRLTLMLRYTTFGFEQSLRVKLKYVRRWKHNSDNLKRRESLAETHELKRVFSLWKSRYFQLLQAQQALENKCRQQILSLVVTPEIRRNKTLHKNGDMFIEKRCLGRWKRVLVRQTALEEVADRKLRSNYFYRWVQSYNRLQDMAYLADSMAANNERDHYWLLLKIQLQRMKMQTVFDSDDEMVDGDETKEKTLNHQRFQFILWKQKQVLAMMGKTVKLNQAKRKLEKYCQSQMLDLLRRGLDRLLVSDPVEKCRITNQITFTKTGQLDMKKTLVAAVVLAHHVQRWALLARMNYFQRNHLEPRQFLVIARQKLNSLKERHQKLVLSSQNTQIQLVLVMWMSRYREVWCLTYEADTFFKRPFFMNWKLQRDHYAKLEENADKWHQQTTDLRLLGRGFQHMVHKMEENRRQRLDLMAANFRKTRVLAKIKTAVDNLRRRRLRVESMRSMTVELSLFKHWKHKTNRIAKLIKLAAQFDAKRVLKVWYDMFADITQDLQEIALNFRMVRDGRRALTILHNKAEDLKQAEVEAWLTISRRRMKWELLRWKEAAEQLQQEREVDEEEFTRLRLELRAQETLPLSQRLSVLVDAAHSTFLSTPIKSQKRRSRRDMEKAVLELRSYHMAQPVLGKIYGTPPPKLAFPQGGTDIEQAKRRGLIKPIDFTADPTFELVRVNRNSAGSINPSPTRNRSPIKRQPG